jgi:hypothetical protein
MNPTELIDKYIKNLTDWRGKTFSEIREIIRGADAEIIEEWKWMGTPVWSHNGIIAVANAHKDKVKITFHQGVSLPDPNKVFNNGLDGNKWRAIDLYEGDKINAAALKKLVQAAITHNKLNAIAKPKSKPAANNKPKKTRI